MIILEESGRAARISGEHEKDAARDATDRVLKRTPWSAHRVNGFHSVRFHTIQSTLLSPHYLVH